MEEKIMGMVGIDRAFVTAQTYLRKWDSFSRPRLVACDDGREYVIKGAQVGRAVCNEQIVARLGLTIGAPVGEPSFVLLPEALRNAEPELSHIKPGLCHALLFRAGHSDRAGISHVDAPENRPRFALLAVLYGWAGGNDQQLIYPNTPPHLVLSVDHGHFFPGGPNWNAAGLAAARPAAPDVGIVNDARLTPEELRNAAIRLSRVVEDDVCRAVSAPPDDWGMALPERVAAAGFLWTRRSELLTRLGV